MMKRFLSMGLLGVALGGLTACANPLGEPVWSDWDSGQRPVSAYDAEGAGAPTGAINPSGPASTGGYSNRYDSYTPVQTDGRAPQGQVESAPLAPPPGSSMSAPGTGPRADLPPDPYQSRYIQRTKPLAVTGLGSEASTPAAPQKTVTQRTLPIVVAGQGIDRGAERP